MAAALVWGLHYPLIDNALKKLSMDSVLLLTAIPIKLAAPLFHRTQVSDFPDPIGTDVGGESDHPCSVTDQPVR